MHLKLPPPERVSLTINVTLEDDQSTGTETTHTMSNIPLPAAVYIQGRLLDLLTEIHGWGKAVAKGQEIDFDL